VPEYDWIILGVSFVAFVGGLVWAGFQGYRAWRRGYPAFKRMSTASEELNERAAALEQRMAALEQKTAELQANAGHFSRSLAQARVLLDAAQDAKSVVDRVLVFR
jgi:hypothetical protein